MEAFNHQPSTINQKGGSLPIDRIPCEFFLVRYVPDPVKGEFVNIGVILREVANGDSHKAAPIAAAPETRIRFTRDWSRVRCLDAGADIALLEALEAEIEARLKLGSADPKPVLAQLADTLSNSIQMTEPRASLAETLPAELDLLTQLYIDTPRERRTRTRTGRAAIAAQMRTRFEAAGVWALMRKRIAASAYTQPGDPLRLDCGYRAGAGPGEQVRAGGGTIKIFHAVSLDSDLEAAKVLAFSAPRLREGIARVERAKLELTAVVEPLRAVARVDTQQRGHEDDADSTSLSIADGSGEAADRYRFGVTTMEEQAIRVITVNDLARAAAAARTDLRL